MLGALYTLPLIRAITHRPEAETGTESHPEADWSPGPSDSDVYVLSTTPHCPLNCAYFWISNFRRLPTDTVQPFRLWHQGHTCKLHSNWLQAMQSSGSFLEEACVPQCRQAGASSGEKATKPISEPHFQGQHDLENICFTATSLGEEAEGRDGRALSRHPQVPPMSHHPQRKQN